MALERQRVNSGSPYESTFGFCRAVRVGERVVVAGTAPSWPDGSCNPDPAAQARRCLEIIVTALEELGAAPVDVVRTRIFITDVADAEAIGRAHGAVLGEARPAATMVDVAGLLDPRWKVEIGSRSFPVDLPGPDRRPVEFESEPCLQHALEIGQAIWPVPDCPWRFAGEQGPGGQRPRRLADVPFHRMQPVTAVGDVGRAQVLVGG